LCQPFADRLLPEKPILVPLMQNLALFMEDKSSSTHPQHSDVGFYSEVLKSISRHQFQSIPITTFHLLQIPYLITTLQNSQLKFYVHSSFVTFHTDLTYHCRVMLWYANKDLTYRCRVMLWYANNLWRMTEIFMNFRMGAGIWKCSNLEELG
jgi:hypothetical protein